MAKNRKIRVQGSEITLMQINQQDFISLTDIAKHKTEDSSAVIGNWMRNCNTIEFLGVWETLFNPNFKPLEFEGFMPAKPTAQYGALWENSQTVAGRESREEWQYA